MFIKTSIFYLIITACICITFNSGIYGSILISDRHDNLSIVINDSTEVITSDSLYNLFADSVSIDTVDMNDSIVSKGLLDSPINYDAEDSVMFSIDNKKVFLYGNAVITYQNMELRSAFIELNLENNDIFAKGMPDSAGVITGYPVFKEDEESYEAEEMHYNFKTRKGIIKEVMTEESDGILRAELTKRHSNGEIHLKKGKYMTCDHDPPHFYIALTKAKAIPNDKIVSGPAYLVVEDVPLYFLILPFGFFPSTRTHSSGIILPEYGEEEARGFYLRGGGYYFAINDYLDLTLMGDFFTNGTWGGSSHLNYKKRYRFSGNTEIRYYLNASGDSDIPGNLIKSNDFSFKWSHNQDSKSNPYSRLSGSVNLSTSSFDENYSRQHESHLTNTKQSNISYSKSWPNKPFNLSLNLRHNQNTLSEGEQLKFTLPSMTFNVARQYPFRSKKGKQRPKWIENIGIDYKSNLANNLKTTDSLFFNHLEFEEKDFGFKHTIPISTSIKFLRFFTLSPRLTYDGVLYRERIHERRWEYTDSAQTTGKFVDSLEQGLFYAQGYKPGISLSANPTLYGMYMFKQGMKVQAVRHIIDPSISISFVPDMKDLVESYYRDAYSPTDTIEYSIYANGMYGTPTISGESGSLGLSLRNNVEMKVRDDKDTAQDVKKIKIIDNLNMSTSYNLFAKPKQRAWSPISISTSNSFFNNKLNVRFSATADMYAIDSIKNKIDYNKYMWQTSNTLVRFTNARVSFGYAFKSKQKEINKSEDEEESDESIPLTDNYLSTGYVDFDIPWSFRFDYSFVYSKPLLTPKVTQTLSFSGDFSLTPKWKFTYRSGWDFERNELTYTTVNIVRDLHCWTARFNWVPFGKRKSYGFTISANSSILRDLKWDKPRESWYDNR